MPDVTDSMPLYGIGVARSLTGLTERQLRYWDKMGLVVPHRTQGNKRLYSPRDVALLKEVAGYLREGATVAQVRDILARRDLRRRLKLADEPEVRARRAGMEGRPTTSLRDTAEVLRRLGELKDD